MATESTVSACQWLAGAVGVFGALVGAIIGFLGNYLLSRQQVLWQHKKTLNDRKDEGYAKSINFLIRSIPTTVEYKDRKYMLKEEYDGRMQDIMQAQFYVTWLGIHCSPEYKGLIAQEEVSFWNAVRTIRDSQMVDIEIDGKKKVAKAAGDLPDAIDKALKQVLDCAREDLTK